MRYRSPKESWPNRFRLSVALLAFFAGGGAHAIDATPFAPQIPVTQGETTAIYYADPSLRSGTDDYYLSPDFFSAGIDHTKDLGVTGTGIKFSFSGLTTEKPYLQVFVLETGGTSRVPIRIAACNDLTCPGVTYFQPGISTGTVTLTVNDICRNGANPGGGLNVAGCDGTPAVFSKASLIPGVTVIFVASATTTTATTEEIDDGDKFKLYPQIAGPQIVNCPPMPGFFPGDEEILIDSNAITAQQNATSGGSPNFTSVWVAATRQSQGGLVPKEYDTTAERFNDAVIAQGEQRFGGYENSTSDNGGVLYELDIGIQDSAGVITFCGDGPAQAAGYPIQDAFATNIQGFLRESNCFVATASYRDGRAPGVMLLREFRDEILSEFPLGRDFVAWYYANGPRAADWLLERPIFRTVALAALVPLQAIAWLALHPAALFVPFGALAALALALAFAGLRARRLRGIGVLAALVVVGAAFPTSDARAAEPAGSTQPYIDSLVSELPREQFPARTSENPDPYIQSVRKKLGPGDDATGYTESLRKEIPAKDGSEGYTKRVGRGLPKETGSAIEDYRKGKQLKANKGDLRTRSAFGFKLAASTTRTYAAGANQDVAFEQVYGDSWLPDFTFHYEWRPFTSPVVDRLGLYGSLGGAFAKADGVLQFIPPGSTIGATRSRTEFRFISIPANVGLIYRANIADFLFPFFGGGPSAIGFIENRSDKKGGNRGYTFGYWFTGGVAFGLDWISPRASWDQYESMGTKHSYLTIDYTYLESMAGGLVEFTVDGIQVGFTFEM